MIERRPHKGKGVVKRVEVGRDPFYPEIIRAYAHQCPCARCGNPLPDNNAVCRNCGAMREEGGAD